MEFTVSDYIAGWQTAAAWVGLVIGAITASIAWNIGRKQNEINQRLLEMQASLVHADLLPQVRCDYDMKKKRLELLNRGKRGVNIENMRISGHGWHSDQVSIFLPPGDTFGLPFNKQHDEIVTREKPETRLEIECILKNEMGKYFLMKNHVYFALNDKNLTTRAFTVDLKEIDGPSKLPN